MRKEKSLGIFVLIIAYILYVYLYAGMKRKCVRDEERARERRRERGVERRREGGKKRACACAGEGECSGNL